MAAIVLAVRNEGAVQILADTEVSLFLRDRVTGRLVFNPKAIEALGLSPTELAQRGYPLDGDVTAPRLSPEGGAVSVSGNG